MKTIGWSALALMVTLGCAHEVEEEAPRRFDVAPPLRQDTPIVESYVAQIRAIQHIEVRAIEEGYLERIFVDEGERVEEGQRLFQIVPVVYRAELARGAAEAQLAAIEYANTETLREGNVVSDNQLALARARMERAGAERDIARAHLRFASLDAPFAGLVGRLHVRRGSLLEEGELLTVLSDNHEMWVYFNVSEAQYLAYRAAHDDAEGPRTVQLRLANGEVFEHDGVIQTIEADFNNETGTIAFRAGFPNPDGLLRHGETGSVLMTRVVEDALVIPQSATYDVLDRTYVFVVGADGVIHAREIHVAEELEHLYVVRDGLDEHDRVLLEGLRRVADGDRVDPVERDPSEVFAELDLPAE